MGTTPTRSALPQGGAGAVPGGTARAKAGAKGHPILDVRRRERDERALRPLFEALRDKTDIEGKEGKLSRDEVRTRLRVPTLADLDELIIADPELGDGISSMDTRPLREILDRRAGKQKPPERPVSTYPVGDQLSDAQRRQFASDLVEVLDLARALLLDEHGRRAAFRHELDAVENLRVLAAEHRARLAVYKERARTAQMLIELYGIYDEAAGEWPQKVYEKRAKQWFEPPWDSTCDRIMERQRTELRAFCTKHGLAQDMVSRLERTGSQIREGLGAAKEAPQALGKVLKRGGSTINTALDASPFQLARASRKPLLDSVRDDAALAAYDEAARVLREIFAVLTESTWPQLSTSCQVPGWPRMKADVLVALGWRLQPLRAWPSVRPRYWFRRSLPMPRQKLHARALQEQLRERPRKMIVTGSADVLAERFIRFLLNEMTHSAHSALLRALFAEFSAREFSEA